MRRTAGAMRKSSGGRSLWVWGVEAAKALMMMACGGLDGMQRSSGGLRRSRMAWA